MRYKKTENKINKLDKSIKFLVPFFSIFWYNIAIMVCNRGKTRKKSVSGVCGGKRQHSRQAYEIMLGRLSDILGTGESSW